MQNDDDWVSVEEKKDYSGLKIGTLKIEDKERALKSSSFIYFGLAMDAHKLTRNAANIGADLSLIVSQILNLTNELCEGR